MKDWDIDGCSANAFLPKRPKGTALPHSLVVSDSFVSLDGARFYRHGHAKELVIVETYTGSPSEFFAQ